ncbi:MAG TPA: 1,4-alpha-glucan branching protein GlgB [Candidatus Eremiobacteraeota bacterium]|nr:MAG: 1,4-alpha-glucan branching enzyme GlgB [bacterium ADurb.Bin363]HPZ10325.1 1,4-alpha-glucan branching protein GlgB [Candidatus Eremiobacteraeota bacterium]
MLPTVSWEEIYRIIYLEHHDPFSVLGIHEVELQGKKSLTVRAYLPDAEEAYVLDMDDNEKEYKMYKLHKEGFFEIAYPGREKPFSYMLRTVSPAGQVETFRDSYAFLPYLTVQDVYLFGEGTHHRIYEKLGARVITHQGVGGVHFAVWAPNALRVSVVGNFNNWDGRKHPMRSLGSSGIWEIFIPGLQEGVLYKFEIKSSYHHSFLKTDPYALYMELAPRTASVVYNIDNYKWNDSEWLKQRKTRNNYESPIWIYEVHLGSWLRFPDEPERHLNCREVAPRLIDYVKEMGYTHIELLPIAEHPYYGSWGYQCSGYFSPTSRYGTPEDFMYLIDYCHQHSIGVILDWVPAHFPRDAYALARFDGSCLYEHADPRRGEHQDWGTLIFNYGRTEVKDFLVTNALFWFEKYHIDGLRIDAVASMLYLDYSRKPGEWIPNIYGGKENIDAIEFLKYLNTVVYKYYPGVLMIAEESTAWPQVSGPVYLGGLGFGFKWNMGWMNDILSYMTADPVYRKYKQGTLTFSLMYAFSEKFILPFSHDEIVHMKGSMLNKMPGDEWQKFANLRLLYGFMMGHPGKKLLFMGCDMGQWREWNHDFGLDWHLLQYESHRKFNNYVKDLIHFYKSEPALYEVDISYTGFQWIDFHDADRSVISFYRIAKDGLSIIVFVYNFTPVPWRKYSVGVPYEGYYKEVLNSDSELYWGSNMGNHGGVMAEEVFTHNQPYTITIDIPPLAMVAFKPEWPEQELKRRAEELEAKKIEEEELLKKEEEELKKKEEELLKKKEEIEKKLEELKKEAMELEKKRQEDIKKAAEEKAKEKKEPGEIPEVKEEGKKKKGKKDKS